MGESPAVPMPLRLIWTRVLMRSTGKLADQKQIPAKNPATNPIDNAVLSTIPDASNRFKKFVTAKYAQEPTVRVWAGTLSANHERRAHGHNHRVQSITVLHLLIETGADF